LEELERRLREFGAPIVDAFGPGIAADEIRAVFDAERLDAPDDVVAWWGWHDGAVLSDAPPVLSGPGVYLRSENTLHRGLARPVARRGDANSPVVQRGL